MNPELLDRTPPHDLDAEKAVLGSCLLDASRIDEVAEVLLSEDFYREAHAKAWRRLLALWETTGKADAALLAGELRDSGELEVAGGAAYLAELMHAVPVAAHALYYAKQVAKHAAKRRLIEAGVELIQAGYDATSEASEALDAAEARLRLASEAGRESCIMPLEVAAVEALERIEIARTQHRAGGLMTGLEKYDQTHGGLFDDELILVAARPGLGKTALGIQVAHHIACRGHRVLFVSLEMSAASLALRLLCSLAGVSSREVRTGQISEESAEALSDAGRPLGGLPLWLTQHADTTTTAIRRMARQLASKEGLSLVVVDYIQRLTPLDRRIPRHEQVGQMSGALKSLATELHLPVVCLAQLNREVDKETRPRISHLGESHKLEEDSDVIAVICRDQPEGDDPWEPVGCRLCVLKNRNGETGELKLRWTPAATRFDCGTVIQEWRP